MDRWLQERLVHKLNNITFFPVSPPKQHSLLKSMRTFCKLSAFLGYNLLHGRPVPCLVAEGPKWHWIRSFCRTFLYGYLVSVALAGFSLLCLLVHVGQLFAAPCYLQKKGGLLPKYVPSIQLKSQL